MWDGHLRPINKAKHKIDLISSDVRPIYSAPYRAGPRARKFDGDEIDKMPKMNDTETGQS